MPFHGVRSSIRVKQRLRQLMIEARARAQSVRSIVATLKATYGVKATLDRNDSIISRFVYRPLSFYLAIPFVWLGLSPNQVSFIGFAIALAGMTLIATGHPSLALVGTVLTFLQVIVDYVDGNIARLRGISSHLGKFVDGTIDTVVGTLLPVAVGVGLHRQPDSVLLSLWSRDASFAALMLGTSAGLATCLRSLMIYRLRAARLEAEAVAGARPDSAADARSASHRLARYMDIALRTELFAMLGAIVLFAWLQALGLYLILHCGARVCALGFETLRTVVIARRELGASRSF